MRNDDLPPEARRPTNHLAEVPLLLWLLLAALLVVGFVVFAKWGLGPPL